MDSIKFTSTQSPHPHPMQMTTVFSSNPAAKFCVIPCSRVLVCSYKTGQKLAENCVPSARALLMLLERDLSAGTEVV